MKRTLFTAEHEAFRAMIRDFVAREVVPNYTEWEAAGHAPRGIFQRLGELGVMGMNMPAEYGGSGENYVFNVVLQEETARVGVVIGALRTHLDVILSVLPPLRRPGPARAVVPRHLPRRAALRNRDD